MKYLALALVLLVLSCSENPKRKSYNTPEAIKMWTDYSQGMIGKCLRRWDGVHAVIEKDSMNNLPTWVAISYLNRVCDMNNSNKCVTHKTTDSWMHGSYLQEKIQDGSFTVTNCGKKE